MSQHSKAECAIEYKESLSCLEKKGREACEEFFEAYKDCASRKRIAALPTLTPAYIPATHQAEQRKSKGEGSGGLQPESSSSSRNNDSDFFASSCRRRPGP